MSIFIVQNMEVMFLEAEDKKEELFDATVHFHLRMIVDMF